MKPQTRNVTVKSSGALAEVAYSFDQESMQQIMALLTSIYENPIAAVIREYACNALDSHIEAGVKRPIEVVIGDALSPTLVIRDFGIGLSKDEALRLFGQYGASTKRDTDEQIGSFGIGSKSALAYASSFTIIARKDGQQTTISVSPQSDGTGSLKLVGYGPTFEDNGVEITIPIKSTDAGRFRDEAHKMFRFWKPGTVLVNGREPKRLDGDAIGDGEFLVVNPGALPDDYVVMGNVAYPLRGDNNPFSDDNSRYYNYRRQRVVLFVEIGALTIAPNRESLIYDARTTKAIRAAAKRFENTLAIDAQAAIDAMPTPAEAFLKAHEWRQGTFISDDYPFTYGKDEIPVSINSEYYDLNIKTGYQSNYFHTRGGSGRPFILYDPDSYSRAKNESLTTLDPRKIQRIVDGKVLIVTGWDTRRSGGELNGASAAQHRKLDYYAETVLGKEFDEFLLYHEVPGGSWLDGMATVEWETVSKIRLPKSSIQARKSQLPVKILASASYSSLYTDEIEFDDLLNMDKPIVLISPSDYSTDSSYSTLGSYKSVYGDEYTFVIVGKNRFDRIKREVDVDAYTEAEWRNHIAAVTVSQDTADRWHVRQESFSLLPDTGLDDPDLVRYNGLRTGTKELVELEKAVRIVGQYGVTIPKRSDGILTESDILSRYPLLKAMGYRTPDESHLRLYINYIYERMVK